MIKKRYFILFVISILCINFAFISLFGLWNNKKYNVDSQSANDLVAYDTLLEHIYTPENGFVPDVKTAIQFAQAAASVKFPNQKVPIHNTYSVYWDEVNKYWTVYIYDLFGRATYVVIDKTTGQIINMLAVEG